MPRYLNIVCPICGREARKPITSERPPIHCSRECYRIAKEREIEQRIGEPLKDALYRLYIVERQSYRQINKVLEINQRIELMIL